MAELIRRALTMADTLAEPGPGNLNLTYPMASWDGTPSPGDAEKTSDSVIPGILFGILVPHVVCTIFIFARIWSRLLLLGKWFVDDTLIVAAWLFSTAVCVIYAIAAQSPRIVTADMTAHVQLSDDGDYYYTGDASLDQLRPYILRTYVGLILYQVCLCLTKLSILAFYLRIFASRPLERRLARATVIGVLLFGAPLLCMSVFQCHPAAGLFFGQPMRCFTFDPLLIASTSLHAATDAWLVVLVVPCIVRLEDLPPRQKAALAVVMSLSIFVVVASLTRLQLSLRANHRPSGDGVQVANTLAFFVMTVLELDLALICASAPTLRPVMGWLWPKLGMGEPEYPAGRRRWRWRGGRRRENGSSRASSSSGDEEEGSVDLTSIVSYHGYPWTHPGTPASRSKNPSVADVHIMAGGPGVPPPPPVPAAPPAALLAHRTPTTLSLRSFMSGIAPRSRGHVGAGAGGDRTGLLGEGGDDADVQAKRRSSLGFEGYYYDQYLGDYYEVVHQQQPPPSSHQRQYGGEKRRRQSRASDCYSGRWGDSQESFVLGVNDPNSPARMSPDSGLSGTTRTEGVVNYASIPLSSPSQVREQVHGKREENATSG